MCVFIKRFISGVIIMFFLILLYEFIVWFRILMSFFVILVVFLFGNSDVCVFVVERLRFSRLLVR